ncbi:hypothetical protein OSTOST_25200 [Ostertagia ostertagi]
MLSVCHDSCCVRRVYNTYLGLMGSWEMVQAVSFVGTVHEMVFNEVYAELSNAIVDNQFQRRLKGVAIMGRGSQSEFDVGAELADPQNKSEQREYHRSAIRDFTYAQYLVIFI